MARFFIAFLLTFTLILSGLSLWMANNPMKLFNQEYPMWLAKRTIVDHCMLGTVDVIGDSKAFASIIPGFVGPGVVNLSIGGASLITLHAMAERIVACPNPPKAIIMSLSFKWLTNAECFWEREAGFGLFDLDLEAIRREARVKGDTDIYGEPKPFDAAARLKNFLYTIRFPSYFFSSWLQAMTQNREEMNQAFFHDVMGTRGYHFFGLKTGNTEPEAKEAWKKFAPSPFYDEYFAATLDLFSRHNIPVYFVSPPFKLPWIESAPPNFKSQYKDYLMHWTKLYPNFHLLGDVLPTRPVAMFGDNVHLVPDAAVIWSKNLGRRLTEAHVEGGPFIPEYKE